MILCRSLREFVGVGVSGGEDGKDCRASVDANQIALGFWHFLQYAVGAE